MHQPCSTRPATTLLLAVAAAGTLVGCASTEARRLAGVSPSAVAATVTVTNEEMVEVRLFAVTANDVRWPLGGIQPQQTATFALPAGLLLPSELCIVGVAVARGAQRATEYAMVFPGDRLAVTLRSSGHLSTLLRKR